MEIQKLGTDLLNEKLGGEATLKIIYQDNSKRISLSMVNERVGAYSIVNFNEFAKDLIPERVHSEIVNGKSIGRTIRENKIPFEREEECVFVYRIPKSIQNLFDTSLQESFVKRIEFKTGFQNSHYASIVELYSPLITFNELKENHGGTIEKTVKELNLQFNKENYFLRNVEQQNLKKYLRLTHEFLKKPVHIGIDNKEEFVKDTLDTGSKLIDDPATILIVAQKNDDFIGYLAANIHPALHVNGFECMIRELYTADNSRRQGIASSLVRTLERIARERGAKRISLATNMEDNVQGAFYRSLGYARRCDFVTKYL